MPITIFTAGGTIDKVYFDRKAATRSAHRWYGASLRMPARMRESLPIRTRHSISGWPLRRR